MIHFASKCFQAAYASGRMLVLDEEFFGLKSHFKPLSDSCPYQDLLTETKLQWPYNMTEKGIYFLGKKGYVLFHLNPGDFKSKVHTL